MFNDKLTGDNQKNTLGGGKGNNYLFGDGQADTFVLKTNDAIDRIRDFDFTGSNHDFIDLSKAAGIVSYNDLILHNLKDNLHDLLITTADGSKMIIEHAKTVKNLVAGDFL